mgnify:CR=1 FL=1
MHASTALYSFVMVQNERFYNATKYLAQQKYSVCHSITQFLKTGPQGMMGGFPF